MTAKAFGERGILEQSGEGGMGVVCRAHDQSLCRDLAMKILAAGQPSEESARKRFKKETLALARWNPPIVDAVHKFNLQHCSGYPVWDLSD